MNGCEQKGQCLSLGAFGPFCAAALLVGVDADVSGACCGGLSSSAISSISQNSSDPYVLHIMEHSPVEEEKEERVLE